MNLFDIIKDINITKSYNLHNADGFEKEFNDFMVNRYFSMNVETVFPAEFMNIHWKLPKNAKYLFLSDLIEPKYRSMKYIKADKDSEDNKLLKHIIEFYCIGKDEARMILNTINEDEKKFIKDCYEKKSLVKK